MCVCVCVCAGVPHGGDGDVQGSPARLGALPIQGTGSLSRPILWFWPGPLHHVQVREGGRERGRGGEKVGGSGREWEGGSEGESGRGEVGEGKVGGSVGGRERERWDGWGNGLHSASM